jgi:hypothetical protein
MQVVGLDFDLRRKGHSSAQTVHTAISSYLLPQKRSGSSVAICSITRHGVTYALRMMWWWCFCFKEMGLLNAILCNSGVRCNHTVFSGHHPGFSWINCKQDCCTSVHCMIRLDLTSYSLPWLHDMFFPRPGAHRSLQFFKPKKNYINR